MRTDFVPSRRLDPDRLLLLADTGEDDVAEIISVVTEDTRRNRFDHLDGPWGRA